MSKRPACGAAVMAAPFLLLVTACATLDTTIPESWAPRVELTETPFHAQLEHHCGPAALATVLEAAGASPSYEALVDRIYVPGLEGSLQVELLATTRHYHRIPFRVPGELEAVLAEVVAGRPVLILQNLGLPSRPIWHYAVVIGYDRDRGEILMRSGEERVQVTRLRPWMRQWDWASRWAMVVLRPGELPVHREFPPIVRALADFDDHGSGHLRLQAWLAVADYWPLEALAWMGVGNAHYSLGALAEAARNFETALQLQPDHWPARLNLAVVLLEQDHSCRGRDVLAARPMASDHPWREVLGDLTERLERACADQSADPVHPVFQGSSGSELPWLEKTRLVCATAQSGRRQTSILETHSTRQAGSVCRSST